MASTRLATLDPRTCVLLCFIKPILGNRLRSRCFPQRRAKEYAPTKWIADVPPHPVPSYRTLGGRILTLHLNYVAGCTDPLLFLFERTQQLTPLTTRGFCPGGSVSGQVQSSFGLIGEGPECHAGKISWVLWPRYVKSSSTNDQSKATLVLVKKKKTPEGESTCAREVEDPRTTLSHCNRNEACNTTEEANEPVDPTTEQNQWSFWPGC